jgi:hypothetical protein
VGGWGVGWGRSAGWGRSGWLGEEYRLGKGECMLGEQWMLGKQWMSPRPRPRTRRVRVQRPAPPPPRSGSRGSRGPAVSSSAVSMRDRFLAAPPEPEPGARVCIAAGVIGSAWCLIGPRGPGGALCWVLAAAAPRWVLNCWACSGDRSAVTV